MNKLVRKGRRGLHYGAVLLRYQGAGLLGHWLRLFDRSLRDLWLIAERGTDARDNGYHFFRYVRTHHPEINACYVIRRDSADGEKVRRLGPTVDYGSLRHWMMCAVAQVRVSTHVLGYTPSIDDFYMLDKIGVVKGPKVFLQHGIIKDDIAWLYYPNVKIDLFVCTAKREAAFVRDTFGHPAGVVRQLGLCRFDALLRPHKKKRQVLIAPTWRSYATEGKSGAEFRASDYYGTWQSLLDSPKLAEILEKYKYQAVFYPHYEAQRFLSSFHTRIRRMQIAGFASYDVQRLLMESALLVTDFSSVFFDFAYLEKPVMYYQFDEERFRKEHYGRGYFSYREDGFGPVVTEEGALLEKLETMLASDCSMPGEYQARVRGFFGPMDGGNCGRNFEAVQRLVQRNRRE